jgi:DNA mismatch endonuclease, patch repair protein
MMSRFRKTDSGPELALRRALTHAQVRFETYPKLPGSPDVVLADARIVVFVQGCFWHGCPTHYRAPRTKPGYWSQKLESNKSRDRAASRRLRNLGWHVATVWECSLKRNPNAVVRRLSRMAKRLPKDRVRADVGAESTGLGAR